MLNGPTLFSQVNHIASSYSVVACQFNFFTLSVSQMISHKLTNSNRKGVELGFRANMWHLNFAAEVSELVILCQCARTAAQTMSNCDT